VSGSEPQGESPLVLFVAGMNRSGTTLLDAVLGEPEGMVSTGELHYLWRGLVEGWNCGCGEPLRDCPVWSTIREEVAAGGLSRWRELDAIQRAQVRSRPIRLLRLRHRLAAQRPASAAELALADYRDTLARLYRAIGDVMGAEVIVDSSKGAHDAIVLAGIAGLPSALVHMVRDPRAVAHSWTVRLANPALPGGHLEQAPPPVTAARWLAWNAAIESVVRPAFRPRFRTLRYEDLCADPAASIASIYEMIGRTDVAPAVGPDGEMELTRGHSIAGDPRLAARGRTRIEATSTWRSEMGPAAKAAVSAITLPMLGRYGYRMRTDGGSPTG
jgi:sulfotransferase family protein